MIASDLPVFREIAGDIPDYLDPLDDSWERAIMDYVAMIRIQIANGSSWIDWTSFQRADLERITSRRWIRGFFLLKVAGLT